MPGMLIEGTSLPLNKNNESMSQKKHVCCATCYATILSYVFRYEYFQEIAKVKSQKTRNM